MRDVCIDVLNPRGAPTVRALTALMPHDPGVRQVLFDDPKVYSYLGKMASAGIETAVVAAGESFTSYDYELEMANYAQKLPEVKIWLLGNEPNAEPGADSSWVMAPNEYIDFWNRAATGVKSVQPDALCYIGGMLGSPGDWVDEVLESVSVTPDGLDIHYPESESVLDAWEYYQLPLSVMEWNYVGAKVPRQDVVNWLGVIQAYAKDSAWFSYHYFPGPASYMSLLGPSGDKRKSWRDFHAAVG